jgi:hypothetical protein
MRVAYTQSTYAVGYFRALVFLSTRYPKTQWSEVAKQQKTQVEQHAEPRVTIATNTLHGKQDLLSYVTRPEIRTKQPFRCLPSSVYFVRLHVLL